MTDHIYIKRNPDIMLGKPIIIGTRITVELIVRKLAGGHSVDDLLVQYPHLQKVQILAALKYANLIYETEIDKRLKKSLQGNTVSHEDMKTWINDLTKS